jgi:transcriptional regulator with XRE-family HTH domain
MRNKFGILTNMSYICNMELTGLTYKRIRIEEGIRKESVSKALGISVRTLDRFESGDSELGYKKFILAWEYLGYKLEPKKI